MVTPGDFISFTVTPPGHVLTGNQIAGGDYPWYKIDDNPASWRCTVPDNPAGQHSSHFDGTYQPLGGSGTGGPPREYTWKMDTDEILVKVKSVTSDKDVCWDGSTITFTAVPDPSGASFPGGFPTWTATSGAFAGGNVGATVAWTAPSGPGGDATITATCGSSSASKTVKYCFMRVSQTKNSLLRGESDTFSIHLEPSDAPVALSVESDVKVFYR